MIESKKYWLVGDNTNKRRKIYNVVGNISVQKLNVLH